MSWMTRAPSSPSQRTCPRGRSSSSVPVTSTSPGPASTASTRMVLTWTGMFMGSPPPARILGFRSPRPLGPQPQDGLRLALRPRDVLRLALPGSSGHHNVEEILRRRAERVLVGLFAPQEVEPPEAPLDGVPDQVTEQHDPRGENGVSRIQARVVETAAPPPAAPSPGAARAGPYP